MKSKLIELAQGDLEQVETHFHTAFSDGLFEHWFRGFARLKGCNQGEVIHLEGDALVHTGKVFAHASQAGRALDENSFFVLLAAALVHDICKPQTRRPIGGGKVTFYGHAERAVTLCPMFARNLGMDDEQSGKFAWLVARHMHAHDVPKFGPVKRLTFYREPAFPIMRVLQQADALATWKNIDGSLHAEVLYDFFLADEQDLSTEVKCADK